MEWQRRKWDIHFSTDVLLNRLPIETLEILPVGGRGRKLDISRDHLILPNIHKKIVRICRNSRLNNGEVSSYVGKKISQVLSEDIEEFSKKMEERENVQNVQCTKPDATKSEYDISSSLLSSHVESLMKEKKSGNMVSPYCMVPSCGNAGDTVRGITTSTERDRKEIESNIIEISNNLQNMILEGGKKSKDYYLSTKVGKQKVTSVDKGKQNISNSPLNTEVLTPNHLFPRPLSLEESKKRHDDMYSNLFPQLLKPSTSLSALEKKSFPDFLDKLEVQDVVINDNKPAKFSLHRNSLITSTKYDTDLKTKSVTSNFQPPMPNTLPAIPLSLVIADPTSIQNKQYYNDHKFLKTLAEKELFVVIEHIPVHALKDLEELISSFGTIVLFITEMNSDETERIGLLKMSDSSECEWVVACLDGYIWDEMRLVVRKAVDIL